MIRKTSCNKAAVSLLTALGVALAAPAQAHHGVAGLGVAGLEGPGAPIESATSATLPEGMVLGYLKLDRAEYEKFDPDPANPESDYADYWLAGIGYGFTPWLSGYALLPYHHKVDEPGGYDTSGAADMSVSLPAVSESCCRVASYSDFRSLSGFTPPSYSASSASVSSWVAARAFVISSPTFRAISGRR